MQACATFVDTLYNAIIAYTVRILRAYIYADEGLYSEEDIEKHAPTFEALPAPAVHVALSAPKESGTDATVANMIPARGMVMYVGNVGVSMYKNPTIEFDAEVARVPFGSMVITGEPKGRFYPVTWGNMRGWMLREDLVDRATYIYPTFTVGEENLVDTPTTAQVRTLIQDAFGLARSEFPLQAGEYITYRLWRRGVTLDWPDIRPRMPGSWHKILKGVEGVYIRTTPKVGSIMEYVSDEEMGYLAYVDAVFPDDTISVSEVNNPNFGVYTEVQWTKAEWREFRPVFIEVTSRR